MRDIVLEYLREQAPVPFQWGKTDCVQLAAGMVARLSGRKDLAAAFQYSSEIEAKRLLVERGGLEAVVTSVLGEPERDLRKCCDGDIVLTSFKDTGHLLGVALPRHFYVKTQDGRLMPLDLTLAIKFWPCPRS